MSIYRLAKESNVPYATCNDTLKEKGDIDFIIDLLESDEIRTYYEREWYPESLYLLAMLDYLCRENCVPICDEYDDLRNYKLEKSIYPTGIITMSVASKNPNALQQVLNSAIPKFKRFNIIECNVRNVV